MYEWKYIDASNEVTLEQLINAEKEEARRELKKKRGKYEVNVRRVFPGLYDMSTGDSTHSRNITYNGVEYHLTEWNLSPEYNITRRVYWNLLTNKAHKGTGKESLERVTLVKPGIPYPPKREVKPYVPLQGPIGLVYALRMAYDRNDILNYELGFLGDMNVKIGD